MGAFRFRQLTLRTEDSPPSTGMARGGKHFFAISEVGRDGEENYYYSDPSETMLKLLILKYLTNIKNINETNHKAWLRCHEAPYGPTPKPVGG